MTRDPRYDVLFQPVQIGPVTAPNRFYQVPHGTGMGSTYPNASATMRATKAEGGWGVVSTEMIQLHETSDPEPLPYGRLWDDSDIPAQARMVDMVHSHGALAAIQLGHLGLSAKNLYSRSPSLGPTSIRGLALDFPMQSRKMDLSDIREFRAWHRAAALRAKSAGFDIVYVYAGHSGQISGNFLSRVYNTRSDQYGGSFENRLRLISELLSDTKDAVGQHCAVAFRFSVDQLIGETGLTFEGEGREVVERLAEVPDLWDVNVAGWANDSMTARFADEGFQEKYISFVKTVTSKPVVGVGRFTSPDTMVSQINRGILDFIGAARPSIADPFLPLKIAEGNLDDIRECIGCNICVATERSGVPIRCTQNPTMGEEWRKGWHPEHLPRKERDARVLVIGAGPAGLECSVILGKRGYEVALAERGRELGGRVAKESRLPGLATWVRVRDHRVQALDRLPNVAVYRESEMNADAVLELGFEHVIIATGAVWRKDGVGPSVRKPVRDVDTVQVFSPDDVFSGVDVPGPVLVYDDDHYYLGGVLCELFRSQGKNTTLVTPLNEVSAWTEYTLEQRKIQSGLLAKGVTIRTGLLLQRLAGGEASFVSQYSQVIKRIPFASIVLVTSRHPSDMLYYALLDRNEEFADLGIKSVRRIGDCLAPSIIAAAVYSGHQVARDFSQSSLEAMPFRREQPNLVFRR